MSKLRNADDDFPFRLFYLGEVLPAFRLTFFFSRVHLGATLSPAL